MRVYYPDGFLGAPVLELPPETVASVFSEMDTVAAKLRACSQFVECDLQIAFYKLQRERIGNLSKEKEDWLWLFDLWRDHDRGLQELLDAERAALWDSLTDEREVLFLALKKFPEHRTELTARLYEIGCGLAELEPTFPAAPLGEWM